jgi:imidazolonepropionase-like amidohydrolase
MKEIARAGGGIVSSVKATRPQAKPSCSQTLPRLDALIAEGVTTVEIKSGYGLDLGTKLKQLRAAAGSRERPVACARPFSARMRAAGSQGRSNGYIEPRRRPDARQDRRTKTWPTRSMASARASPSRRRRWRASSTAAKA